ncbi:hypothetical protein HSACCH_00793 [Halanaerobium saccharolyticum subsp. saccharolyticum DSM 6643]|uniref:Uncharacterized protein n=1 Tax=Halanaerobium saccharolyticum subsp. saccharolyticum DSM 6643 TaxID=1293054 RepID=M5DZS7_9FIRM|nr:hypothetical protein [Halanaerobium saccharolyticum]CCU78654.1 hypothetical protein HSACCH_00793 [Halanaerobium saccharolyticum subsp. saccharolyticum DSM 6643]
MKIIVDLFSTILIILTLILSFKSDAQAHVPLDTSGAASKKEPIFVEDHQISWAAYNQLEQAGDVDYYSFKAEQGEDIYFSMVIPVIDRYQDFKPDLALIGPALENDYADYDPDYINSILKLEADENIIIVRDDNDNPDTFFEPFTRTSYWKRQEFSTAAPATGTYYLAVFSGEEAQGKYTLAIGRKEIWALKDIIKLPKIVWDTRIFVEKKNSTYLVSALIIALSSFILYKFMF